MGGAYEKALEYALVPRFARRGADGRDRAQTVYSDELTEGLLPFTLTLTGGVTGSITVPGQTSVTAAFDTSDWLKPASFQLSTGAEEKLDSSQLQTEKSGRSLQTVAADSFTGTLYAYWPFDTEKFSNGTGLTLTAVYTPAGGTEQRQEPQALKSKVSGIDGVLAAGVQGNTVVYRASTQDERGMTQYQDYTLTIRRMPTLKTLRVTEASGTAAALDSFDKSARTYTWKVLSDQVTLSLTPTETDGCRLYVAGKDVTEAKGCTLTIDEAEKYVTVEVQAGGETTEHAYTAIVPDTISTVYLWLNGDVATAKTTFSVRYNSIASTSARDDQPQDSGNLSLGSPAKLNYLLLSKNGRGNTLTVRCQRTSGDVTYYQDYIVTLQRSFSLENLSIACGGQAQALMRGDGSSGYTASVWDYTVTVPATATELTVSASVYSVDGCCRDGGKPGYHVWLGEQELQSGEAAVVKLTGTEAPESFTLMLKNEFADEALASEYHIQVRKAQPLSFTPQLTPADALLFVVEPLTGQRIWPDADGAYALSDGFTYRYLLTRTGYAGRSGTLKAAYTGSGTLVLQIDEASVPVKDGAAAAEMTIEAAPKNDTLLSLPAEWADFRGMSYAADGTAGGSAGSNNAVISGKTPVDADKATLYWSNALGSGRDSDATGCPLLVDDVLIVYAGDTIYRVDPVSGEILKQAKMNHASDYATVPPAYAKGMVFVGLADGTIQAFNAKTLESLWIYRDALGGQPNCPITICGDYLYTGFWRYETTPANFVCLSITDEDPSNPKEEKTARWYWTADGGYTEYSRLILARQNPDGGWSLGGASDPDLTAMALQALAKYRSRTDVLAAVDAGLSCLSQLQQENGAFLSWDAESGEAVSQVLVALTELGLSPDDARFVKNGQTLEDVLLRFAQSDGSFAHTPDGRGDLLASTQAFYALAAVQRAREGKTTLYDMSDIAP